ncbi:hypothetical protein QPK14_13385 [Photorhabdus temperata subsp. temperata]
MLYQRHVLLHHLKHLVHGGIDLRDTLALLFYIDAGRASAEVLFNAAHAPVVRVRAPLIRHQCTRVKE